MSIIYKKYVDQSLFCISEMRSVIIKVIMEIENMVRCFFISVVKEWYLLLSHGRPEYFHPIGQKPKIMKP